jgi:hypothetical protein
MVPTDNLASLHKLEEDPGAWQQPIKTADDGEASRYVKTANDRKAADKRKLVPLRSADRQLLNANCRGNAAQCSPHRAGGNDAGKDARRIAATVEEAGEAVPVPKCLSGKILNRMNRL